MNAELKARWVKALRSGRYRQTTRRLSRGPASKQSNCCLGVLCRVARVPRHRWSREVELQAAELNERLGLTRDDELQLIYRNDGVMGHDRHSFAEIADYIEANL